MGDSSGTQRRSSKDVGRISIIAQPTSRGVPRALGGTLRLRLYCLRGSWSEPAFQFRPASYNILIGGVSGVLRQKDLFQTRG